MVYPPIQHVEVVLTSHSAGQVGRRCVLTPIKLFKDNFCEEFSQLTCHKDASAINVGFVAEQELKRVDLRKNISDLTLLTI